ncbi:hypothetical protein [Methylobacterium sp. JK268]
MTRGQRGGRASGLTVIVSGALLLTTVALGGAVLGAAMLGPAAAQSDLEGPGPDEPVLSKPYRSSVPQFRRPWREPSRDPAPAPVPAETAPTTAAPEAAPAPTPAAAAPPARPARVIPPPGRDTAAAAPPPPREPEEAEEEETPLPTFVGVWGPTAASCSARRARRLGYLRAVIRDHGAQAGRTACAFRDTRREGHSWTMAATCRNARQRWTSHVRLSVDGNRLTWSSERGASVYVRCGKI